MLCLPMLCPPQPTVQMPTGSCSILERPSLLAAPTGSSTGEHRLGWGCGQAGGKYLLQWSQHDARAPAPPSIGTAALRLWLIRAANNQQPPLTKSPKPVAPGTLVFPVELPVLPAAAAPGLTHWLLSTLSLRTLILNVNVSRNSCPPASSQPGVSSQCKPGPERVCVGGGGAYHLQTCLYRS